MVTARFIGQPQSKWRSGSNKNYLRTKCAFHGYQRGNFWSKEIACRERMAQNRCCGVIISIQSLVFCVEELLQPQAKPVFGVIIMRKKLTKIQNFLPLQPWPQCSQSKHLLRSWRIIKFNTQTFLEIKNKDFLRLLKQSLWSSKSGVQIDVVSGAEGAPFKITVNVKKNHVFSGLKKPNIVHDPKNRWSLR